MYRWNCQCASIWHNQVGSPIPGDASPYHNWPTSVAVMLSNICSLKPFSSFSPNSSMPICESRQNIDSSVNRTCLKFCMVHCLMPHGPFQTGLAMSTRQGDMYARFSRPQSIFMQPSTYRLRGNTDPAAWAMPERPNTYPELGLRPFADLQHAS